MIRMVVFILQDVVTKEREVVVELQSEPVIVDQGAEVGADMVELEVGATLVYPVWLVMWPWRWRMRLWMRMRCWAIS